MRARWWLGLGWIQRAATGGFRTEVYGFCCGYLSRSPARAGFLNAHGVQVNWIDGQKPWLKEKPDYVRDGDFMITHPNEDLSVCQALIPCVRDLCSVNSRGKSLNISDVQLQLLIRCPHQFVEATRTGHAPQSRVDVG